MVCVMFLGNIMIKLKTQNQEFSFRDPVITIGIGQEKNFDLCLKANKLQGECIQIIADGKGSYSVINLSSSSITINNQPFQAMSLHSGDVLKIEDNILVFENIYEINKQIIHEVDSIITKQNSLFFEVDEILKKQIAEPKPKQEPPSEKQAPVVEEFVLVEPEPIVEEKTAEDEHVVKEIEKEEPLPALPQPKKKYSLKVFLFLSSLFVLATWHFLPSKTSVTPQIEPIEYHVAASAKRIMPGLPPWSLHLEKEISQPALYYAAKYQKRISPSQYHDMRREIEGLAQLYLPNLQQIEYLDLDNQKTFELYKDLENMRRTEITATLDIIYSRLISQNPKENKQLFYNLVTNNKLISLISPELGDHLSEYTDEIINSLINQLQLTADLTQLDNALQQIHSLSKKLNPELKNEIKKTVFEKLDNTIKSSEEIPQITKLKNYSAIEHILDNAEIFENNVRNFYRQEIR
jgi:hypothetical protein